MSENTTGHNEMRQSWIIHFFNCILVNLLWDITGLGKGYVLLFKYEKDN